jgi:hypothetical protein
VVQAGLAASVNLYLSVGVTCLMSGDIIITLGSCFGSLLLPLVKLDLKSELIVDFRVVHKKRSTPHKEERVFVLRRH